MAKYGDPVNIDAALRNLSARKNRIALVGVELEGAWNATSRVGLIRDGSLDPWMRRLQTEAAALGKQCPYVFGELPSPPTPPSEIEAWMLKYYPAKVDETCGLHVHMSFKTSFSYQRLACDTFPPTMLEYLKRWAEKEGFAKTHHIWPRLEGKSRYCQPKFFADQQMVTRVKDHDQQRDGCRYTAVGFPYSRTGTIEVRVLPMMETVEQGVRAVQHVLAITNAFLTSSPLEAKRQSSRVPLRLGDEIREVEHHAL